MQNTVLPSCHPSHKPQLQLGGNIASLVDLCVNALEKNWQQYEFNFTGIPLHLKFKILMCIHEKHSFKLTEYDLYSIFPKDEFMMNNFENLVKMS